MLVSKYRKDCDRGQYCDYWKEKDKPPAEVIQTPHAKTISRKRGEAVRNQDCAEEHGPLERALCLYALMLRDNASHKRVSVTRYASFYMAGISFLEVLEPPYRYTKVIPAMLFG